MEELEKIKIRIVDNGYIIVVKRKNNEKKVYVLNMTSDVEKLVYAELNDKPFPWD